MKKSPLPIAGIFVALLLFSSLAQAQGNLPKKTLEKDRIACERAKRAANVFRENFYAAQAMPALKEYDQIGAVKKIAKIRHPLVLQELVHALKEKNPYVKSEVLKALGKMDFDVEGVGKIFLKELRKAKDKRIILGTLEGIEKLQYRGAYKDLVRLLRHKDDDIVIRTVELFGETKELRAMKRFLSIFEFQAAINPSSGVKNRWQAGPYSPIYRIKRLKVEQLLKTMKKAMKQISGVEIKTPQELRAWIKKNKNLIRKEDAKGHYK